jgi:deoxyribodipyrimidine photo-lyase
MRTLMWFRADLRVRDNTALTHACREADDGVVGVFLLAPGQWREHDWAGCRVDFILRTVRALAADLAKLNIALIVAKADRFSDAPGALARIAGRSGCASVHFNREYELNELRRDEAVRAALEGAGVRVRGHDDQVILAPGEVTTGEGRFYTVFTPFKRAWIARVRETDAGKVLTRPRAQARIDVEATSVPVRAPGFSSDVAEALWPAGEEEARKRLRRFVASGLTGYKDNRDAPAAEGTSRLSPYLAVGAISPRECLRAAVDANGGQMDSGSAGAVQWISELIWREFYKHVVAGYPRVCMGRAFKPAADRIAWCYDEAAFAAWCEGRTGVPFVDAGMRQLKAEGWMHNRVRMVTAMYLTKDLFIDWRWGEKYFMQHLIDGDFASNNGGWQWSASTGTDAAPYFRIFNPVNQGRAHDPDGAYVRRYVAELAELDAETIHDPPPLVRARLDYPKPIVDHAAARERVMRAFGRAGT